MTTKTYQLETWYAPAAWQKSKEPEKDKWRGKIQVLFNSSKAKVTFDENVVDSETIKKAIEKVGFEVLGEK